MMDYDEEVAFRQAQIQAIEILRAAAEKAGDRESAIALAETKSDAENDLASFKAANRK